KNIRVSKGVRDIPGNFQSASSNIPSGKALMYFGLLLASGVFFLFIAFTLFLPVIVVVPQKFAICFTVGCSFIIGSFFALRGLTNQFAHMSSKERLPFTLAFIGSMMGTIYVSMVLHSYILTVLFSVIQVLALAYYAISYFPGGSAGLKFILSSLTSSLLRCFDGRRQTSLKGADPLLGAFVGLCMCLKQPLFIHSSTFEVQGSPLRRIAQTLVYYETSLKFTALLLLC
ncbi:protein transport protein sft2-like, partial [Olea europaea var. sylvestris]|uniref:protein transport protein sft2-like n=1 Tax=Olea europaea var. sylvestris TaxID=158386 RepID=UPI000C1CE6D9